MPMPVQTAIVYLQYSVLLLQSGLSVPGYWKLRLLTSRRPLPRSRSTVPLSTSLGSSSCSKILSAPATPFCTVELTSDSWRIGQQQAGHGDIIRRGGLTGTVVVVAERSSRRRSSLAYQLRVVPPRVWSSTKPLVCFERWWLSIRWA